ncbi:MAG: type II toxin-antitoxin system RelE/ParE family toxin [Gammaproteobacteria bacterium]|nr:type II toxin-antitoxin system RelE/ParE family toxin [Gammaproteobacteria bacterium]
MVPIKRKLRVPDSVATCLRGLHPQLERKIRSALDALLHDPRCGKALKDELAGLWNLRVGRFRIVYRIAARDRLEIVAVGPRDRIYEETYRLVSKERRPTRG